jgi:thiol-disulfide isomerase/thioredoxin
VSDEPEAPLPLKRRALRWARDILVMLVLFAAVSTVFGRLRAPDLPEQAPPFNLATVDGERVDLAALRGKTVVLNFWATWCGPCRVEIPMISRFARANPDIPVLGIAVDGAPAELKKKAAELGVDYPVLVGTPEVVRAYGASTVPTTVVVNPDGTVGPAHVGIIFEPQLWLATR